MGELKEWVKKTGTYLKFEDGESYEGIYQDYRIIPSSLDPTKETVQYLIDDKFLQTTSKGLASKIDGVPKGSRIRITRKGLGQKTTYEIEILE